MKKILLSAAAFGLALGVATTASAAFDSFSVTGSYSVNGTYMSDGFGKVAAGTGGVDLTEGATGVTLNTERGADSWYSHTFNMEPVMKVNDNITMKSRVRLASTGIWGGNDLTNGAAGREVDIRRIYMEYESPIGQITVGRVPTSAWKGAFMNSEGQGNRIIYKPNFIPESFSVTLLTQKRAEADATATTANGSDNDTDLYLAGLDYKSSAITASIAYVHNRYADNSVFPTLGQDAADAQDLWLYGKGTFGFITVESELSYMFGEDQTWNTFGAGSYNDRDALAFMLDVDAAFGNLTVGGLYFYMSGQPYDAVNGGGYAAQNGNKNVDSEAAMDEYQWGGNSGVGNDFQPYHILTGSWIGILGSDNANSYTTDNETQSRWDVSQAGVHSIGIDASFVVNDKLTLGGAIGTAWADEEQTWNQDTEYGVEYDMTIAYKLLDNLTYTVNLGYLDTGDFFKADANDAAYAQTNTNTERLNDIYLAANTLTMTF